MKKPHFLKYAVTLLVFGCSGVSRSDLDVEPAQGDIVFEIYNDNLHSNSARVYITDPNCNPSSAIRYVEVSSGGKRSVNLSSSDFNPSGFAIYVRLTEGVSGVNVIQGMCSEAQASPHSGSRVVLSIPSSLRYLTSPAIFPLR